VVRPTLAGTRQARCVSAQTPTGAHYHNYDAAGRLTIVSGFDTAIYPNYYFYDASGRPTRRLLDANTIMAYYSYDNAGRLSQLSNLSSSATTLSSFACSRNEIGDVTQVAREGGFGVYYAFDALDRLQRELRVQADAFTPILYGFYYDYDAASNRCFRYNAGFDNQYDYYAYDVTNLPTQRALSGSASSD